MSKAKENSFECKARKRKIGNCNVIVIANVNMKMKMFYNFP